MILFFAAICYGVFINLVTYEAFRADKLRAQMQDWRISESALLVLALLGGWAGAKLGQRHFRHKTRKQPFATYLNAIGILLGGAVLVAVASDGSGINAAPISPTDLSSNQVGEPKRLPHRFGPGSSD